MKKKAYERNREDSQVLLGCRLVIDWLTSEK